MAATHTEAEPGRTACGRDATAVLVDVPPSCRTCQRVAPAPPPSVIDAALDAAELDDVDGIAVQLLRDTLAQLERPDLGDTARAQLTGRVVQLLRELRLTPAARDQAATAPADRGDQGDPLAQLRADSAARRLQVVE